MFEIELKLAAELFSLKILLRLDDLPLRPMWQIFDRIESSLVASKIFSKCLNANLLLL
jgi:hypothetical protein